ncbi:MAG: O-antigen ligase family protein, partial [Thermoleophilaceae bacterium]
VVTALEPPLAQRLPGAMRGALVAYALFVAFNYLSILWADVPGDAWEGANRALLYGMVLALVATRPWSRQAGTAALAVAGFGIAAFALGVHVVAAFGDPLDLFLRGRLSEPAGYANAASALWLLGLFPLLHFAVARLAPWPVRAVALAGAALLLETALLTQSRGGAVAVVVAALVYLIAAPQRHAAVAAMVVLAAVTAISFDTLVEVRDASSAAELASDLAEARAAIALSALAAALLGALAALAAARIGPSRRRGGLARAGNWGMAAVAALAVAAALVAIGNPVDWVGDRWDDFRTSGYSEVESGGSRFGGSLGSNRYDFYRVALNEFSDHPLVGIGSENFVGPYLEQRRSSEAPRWPHSLAFRLLAQLGLVGTGLFLAFLGLTLTAVARAIRPSEPAVAGVAAAALAAFAAWFAQGLVDWLWAFAGLGVVAFALLGVAARSTDAPPVEAAAPGAIAAPPARPGPRRVALALLLVALGLSLALPGIAARYISAAYEDYPSTGVGVVLDRLDRAADLDFLSADPLVAKGVIAQRFGRRRVALDAFAGAVEREPRNWFARFELGLAKAGLGRREAAVAEIRRAIRLNPRQPLAREVLRRVRRGRPVDTTAIERRLNEQLVSKLQPLDPG